MSGLFPPKKEQKEKFETKTKAEEEALNDKNKHNTAEQQDNESVVPNPFSGFGTP